MLMKFAAAMLAALAASASAQAAVLFSFGDASPAGGNLFTVPLSAATDAGVTPISAANLIIRANDGGAANGGSDTSPTITAINFPTTAGTIFDSAVGGASTFESAGLLATRNFTLTTTPSVNITTTPRVLALITVDATLAAGLPFPIFTLSTGSNQGNTTLTAPGGGTISPAVVTEPVTVPEPASLGLLAGAGLVLLRRKRA